MPISPREEIRQDFRKALFVIWKGLGMPPPTKVQYDIAQYLQHGPQRACIEGFRGVGKSFVTSAFAVWLLDNDPHLNILVASAAKTRADAFVQFTRKIIREIPVYNYLTPGPGCRDSSLIFDVGPAKASHSASVTSTGILSSFTGARAHVVIGDDIEVPNNSETQAMRDKISERVKEFAALLVPEPSPALAKVGMQTPAIRYLGTPQAEDSIYNKLPERGYEIRVWPARYPTPKLRENYGGRLAPLVADLLDRDPTLEGKPVDTERFTTQTLNKAEVEYGKAGFLLQFMLDTTLSDLEKYPLKLGDLIVMPCDKELAPHRVAWAGGPDQHLKELPFVGLAGDRYHRPLYISRGSTGHPEMGPYDGVIMAVDPGGRGKDETAYVVVALRGGILYLLDAGGYRDGYGDKTLDGVLDVAHEYKVNLILVEGNFGDGMFEKLLQGRMKDPSRAGKRIVGTEEVKHYQQKERRIVDVLEPVISGHRLVVDQALIERDYQSVEMYPSERAPYYRLMHQMSRVTRDRGSLSQDDRLDALAIAVSHWRDAMARNAEQAEAAARQKALDDELRGWGENVLGGKKGHQGRSWAPVGARHGNTRRGASRLGASRR